MHRARSFSLRASLTTSCRRPTKGAGHRHDFTRKEKASVPDHHPAAHDLIVGEIVSLAEDALTEYSRYRQWKREQAAAATKSLAPDLTEITDEQERVRAQLNAAPLDAAARARLESRRDELHGEYHRRCLEFTASCRRETDDLLRARDELLASVGHAELLRRRYHLSFAIYMILPLVRVLVKLDASETDRARLLPVVRSAYLSIATHMPDAAHCMARLDECLAPWTRRNAA